MAADGLGQVRGDHAARLDHRVAVHLGLVADWPARSTRRACRRPARGWPMPGTLARWSSPESMARNLPGIDRALGHRHVGDLDAVLVLVQPHVVADADLGQDDADLGGHVLADALDALQQVAAAAGIGQADQAHADLDLHRIDGQVVFHAVSAGLAASACFLASAAAWAACSRRVMRHGHAHAACRRSATAESAAGW